MDARALSLYGVSKGLGRRRPHFNSNVSSALNSMSAIDQAADFKASTAPNSVPSQVSDKPQEAANPWVPPTKQPLAKPSFDVHLVTSTPLPCSVSRVSWPHSFFSLTWLVCASLVSPWRSNLLTPDVLGRYIQMLYYQQQQNSGQ
jgi:hypothetical protein